MFIPENILRLINNVKYCNIFLLCSCILLIYCTSKKIKHLKTAWLIKSSNIRSKAISNNDFIDNNIVFVFTFLFF